MSSAKHLLLSSLLVISVALPSAAVSDALLRSLAISAPGNPPSFLTQAQRLHHIQNSHRGLAFCPSLRDTRHQDRWLMAEEPAKLSTAEKIKKYFDDRGIVLMDLPKTIIIYELTSAGLMFAIWGACFLLQPMKRGMALANMVKPGTFETALAKGEKIVTKGGKRSAGMRLVTAYAEGAVLRTALKPAIIPLKLFLTWQLSVVTSFFGKRDPGTSK